MQTYQEQHADFMSGKAKVQTEAFVDFAKKRNERLIDVTVNVYDSNGSLVLDGKALTAYTYPDGAVKLNWYTLRYQTQWVYDTAPGQIIIETKAFDALVNLFSERKELEAAVS